MIGAGPIIIGQAQEFDHSGVQACALKEEVLNNSSKFKSATITPILKWLTKFTLSQYIEKYREDHSNRKARCHSSNDGCQTALNTILT